MYVDWLALIGDVIVESPASCRIGKLAGLILLGPADES